MAREDDDNDALDDLDLELDFDGDSARDILPVIEPARRLDVQSTLEAQNRALKVITQRQEKIISVYGKKLKYLMKKEAIRERDQKFYKQIAFGVGSVFIALIGYFMSTVTTFFKHTPP